ALAERALGSGACNGAPVLVIGVRTAGAYFAPLVSATLKAGHIPVAGWMTVRPKMGLSREEQASLRLHASQRAKVLVIDDHPNTGGTFAKVLALLTQFCVARERIVLLAPEHPAQLDWARALVDVSIVTLPFDSLHKQMLLRDDQAIAGLLQECYGRRQWRLRMLECAEVERLNEELSSRQGDSFETRSKRVYRLQLRRNEGATIQRHVIAKSVGWGWLGYHAALASLRLTDFVPSFVGYRHGLLFSEWVGPLETSGARPPVAQLADLIPAYVAARVERLGLEEDPSFAHPEVRRAGWEALIRVLRRPYGRVLGPLLDWLIRAELAGYLAPKPVLVDGGMRPEEWIPSADGIVKIDFEHHNFGGAQQDVVDPCYDLACAIRELDLSDASEQEVIAKYTGVSGDHGASVRLPLYKLLSGVVAMQTAAYCITRVPSRATQEEWNRRYNQARDFLNIHMARHCVATLGYRTTPPRWAPRLFFLDLDGVFDAELFSPLFQHTTPSGLLALSMLQAGGYSVILNTGRSVRQVKRYCEIYSISGGLAEYGSVFIDAVAGVELPLVDDETMTQLERCRALLDNMPGVFVDPGYRWSLRVYRFDGELTVGLQAAELADAISDFDRLSVIARDADSQIVGRGVDKGVGTAFVRNYLPICERPVVAIGDSEQDLAMFSQVDLAYVPANFAPAYAGALQGARYRKLRQPRQLGLLEAARNLTGGASANPRSYTFDSNGGDLITRLLAIAEQSRLRRLASTFRLGRRTPRLAISADVRL
ncbi:MAG: HAD hydrolase family protein, partial [Acetobacteraceae bacterium]|nr:HAD hydrolase family protein [Acetobacteraceae bacterium]